ncbi:MAG: carotenoid oxygenase family protein [Myxococcota bacterium]
MSRSPLYRDVAREHGFEPLRVEGELPAELEGILYRNGAGLFGSHGRRYLHLFEGQGAISAVRFANGQARGAIRVVESEGWREEREAGRPLYGSAASRPRRIANALRGRSNNAANVSVLAWQGRVFGVVDLSKPIEVSPATLETIGESDLEGAIAHTFSAHLHRVAARDASYGFGIRYGRTTELDLYELPGRGRARRLGSVPIAATAVHDFAATERQLIFVLGPARIAIARALLGEARPERLVHWDAQGASEVLIVPIDDVAAALRIPAEPFFVWHFANAFERGGEIFVDFVRHGDVSGTGTMVDSATHDGRVIDQDEGELYRATIELGAQRLRLERVLPTRSEFPRIDERGEGAERRYVWLTAKDGASPRGIARVDLHRAESRVWTPPPGQHVTEPIFAPLRSGDGETDGFVLVLVFDERTGTSHVAVLDANAPERGPLARAHFDHAVPLTLHGTFVAST